MYKRKTRSFNEHYDNLSENQILTVYTHQGFGYILWFVRELENGQKLAILRAGEKLVSVDSEGNAKDEVDIQLREMDSVNPKL